ncbi:MAG TPA: flagellar hook-associated protein FlgL [Methylococcaceae bacterium]|nr:flagellar hook-associated protein FlgL [Methylococcaceae bacterium]
MRVSNMLAQQLGVDAILNQQARMTKTQMQLSSGMRVLTPADDPAAATRALDLQEAIRVTTQYQDNIAAARNRLTTEDSALDYGTNVLQRARELAIQGANQGALTAQDKRALEQEARQLLSEMESIVNTVDSNGDYLFSGYRTDAKAYDPAGAPVAGLEPNPAAPPAYVQNAASVQYVYQGENSQRLLQIGASRTIADGDPGSSVFEDIPSVTTVTTDATATPPTTASRAFSQNILMVLRNFADALAGKSPTLPDTGALPPLVDTAALSTEQIDADDTIQDSITNLDAALEQLLNTRTTVGARLNALDEQESLNEKFILDSKSFLSDTQDLDYAEAIGRFNLENTALQAAQQAYVKVQGLSLFDFIR